jgi:hypothetical protein
MADVATSAQHENAMEENRDIGILCRGDADRTAMKRRAGTRSSTSPLQSVEAAYGLSLCKSLTLTLEELPGPRCLPSSVTMSGAE